ncbi:unnamed protein product, partial [Effrenium voratum]
VSPAEEVDLATPLIEQLTFTTDGDMEPPQWVSIARPPPATGVAATARMSQFIASWPNLPPSAYSQPDEELLPEVTKMAESGNLPPFIAPPLVYRLNVWLVGVSPDAADADSQATLVRTLDAEEVSGEMNSDVLYRQYDLPPSAFPDPVDYEDAT